MGFQEREAKGLKRCLFDSGIETGFGIHVSVAAPGAASHPPHAHDGVEAFYVLEGQALVSVEGEGHRLGAGEAIVVNAARTHGISNPGEEELRYMVIIAKPG